MSKIDELKKELADLEAKEKEDQEIKNLEKKISAKKFAQSGSGKIFNKIADVGDGLGKAIFTDKGSGASPQSPKKKAKVPTMQEIMDKLPQ